MNVFGGKLTFKSVDWNFLKYKFPYEMLNPELKIRLIIFAHLCHKVKLSLFIH